MVFFILAIMAFLLLFVFRTYRSRAAVIASLVLLFGITSAVLAWGIYIFSQGAVLGFFKTEIAVRDFYFLIAAWYGADLLCSLLIARNYRAYKKVNSAG